MNRKTATEFMFREEQNIRVLFSKESTLQKSTLFTSPNKLGISNAKPLGQIILFASMITSLFPESITQITGILPFAFPFCNQTIFLAAI